MIRTAKELCLMAKEGGYAIGAFNTSTLEATKAILAAASELGRPVIIETSEKEAQFLDPKIFVDAVKEMAEGMSVDVAINFDHGRSYDTIAQAVESGYSSVHFDGSKLEYDENIGICKKVVQFAHEKGLSVEGEFNDIGGGSAAHQEAAKMAPLSDPDQALQYINETGIDIFAGSYGNIHGIYKNEPKLDIDLIRKIASESNVCLSLHGGSGIPDEQIQEAIKAGITKINVNTELRLAYRHGLEHSLATNKDEVVPYEILPGVIDEIKAVVEEKIRLFSFR